MVDHMRTGLGRIAPILSMGLLTWLFVGSPGTIQAQDWNGSASDLWGTAANWTPNTVPNSTSASVTINSATNNPVLIDIAPTIANLMIGAAESASLNNGESLTIAGGAGAGSLDIAGTLTIGSTGSFTDLILGGTSGSTITLSGGGSLTLSDSPNNRVFSTTGDTLVNNAGNTIQGAGQLGINNAGFAFALNNAGIINANQSNALQIAPTNTVTNTGTIEATGGSTLVLIANVTNTGGLMQATGAGSVVELNGSTINGGTLTTSGGGTVQNSGAATLNGVTISSGSTFTAVNASSTTLQGTITINPTSTLAQNSTGSFTDLHISGTVELAGGGTLAMSNSPNNRIFASGSDTLINDSSNTIQGSGQVGINNSGFAFTLTNNGTINANSSGNTLQVAPSNTVTNTNLMEATNGGTLALIGSFTNTGGTIQATGASSVVELNGSAITGGTLTTSGGGTVQNSGTATLNGVTISDGSTFTAVNASSTTLQGTITINPTATLAQSSTGSFTDLHVSGTVELAGGGTLAMSNSFNNRIFATGSDTLINDAGNTIQGSGQLGINNAGFAFTLNNAGIINANQSGGTLQVAPTNTVTNTNLMEATNGGTLALIGSFTNTGGLIQATGASSVVELNGSTITGGTLTTSGGGSVQNSGTATLSGVTISDGSTFTAVNASSTTLLGTITINPTATIAQNSTGSFTDLHVSGTVELAGGGTIAMSNSPNNRIFATGTDTLINDAGNTIQGSGQVGINNAGFAFFLNNKGTIDANQSAALQVAPTDAAGGVTNSGTLEATGGGTLLLTGGTFNNTGSGLILANGAGSVVDFGGSTITGGTLTTQSGGTIQNSSTATLDGTTNSPTISSGSTVTLLNATSTTLMGTIINNGTIAQNSTGSFTDLHISGAVTLTGTGVLALSDSPNNRVFASGSDSLTNDVNHTIQGSGQLGINNAGFGFTLTNNGTILANQSNALNISPSGNTTNNGTFQANSGSLLFMNGTLTNYDPTTSNLTGGTYNAFSGTIQLSQANTGTGAVIATNAATILLDGSTATIADGSGNDILRGLLATNTAAGSFTIQNGANLTTASSGFSNAGTMNIGANSTFTVGGTNDYVQTGGTTTLAAGTSILAVASGHAVDINGGTLQGIGTIQGNLNNVAGTVHPGLAGAAGILTVTGTYTDPPSSHLLIDIGGPNAGLGGFSQLQVGGTASLGGELDVSLINGFTPTNGELFAILTSGGLSGSFTDNVIHDGNVTFTVEYSPSGFPNEVVLDAMVKTSSIPEPASLVMFGIGLAGLGAFVARRRRKSA